tara:strand:- start:399 stop:578 length:180 start_codon:yes stop_codon:yes gene_type:complete
VSKTKEQEIAEWLIAAVNNVQIQGSQAPNVIAAQQFLQNIYSGKLVVVSALEETAGASG